MGFTSKFSKRVTLKQELEKDNKNRAPPKDMDYNRFDIKNSNFFNDINNLVDILFIKKNISLSSKYNKNNFFSSRFFRLYEIIKILQVRKLPIKKFFSVLLSILLVFVAIASASIFTQSEGSESVIISVSLEPKGVYIGDILFINVTVPIDHNISYIKADISGIDSIDLLFDNSSFYPYWTGIWECHDIDIGNHIVKIIAVDNENTTYNADAEMRVISEDNELNEIIDVENDQLNITSIQESVDVNNLSNQTVVSNELSISIVDPGDEQIYALPGTSFYVERTVDGTHDTEVIFAPLFSDGLTIEKIEIVGEKDNLGANIGYDRIDSNKPRVFSPGRPSSQLEARIESFREKLPSDIKQLNNIAYSQPLRLQSPIIVRMWFKAPGWEELKSGSKSSSGKISYLTFANNGGDNFDFESSTWWNSNWGYRKLVTINSSQVDADLTNFPILINITDTDLRDYAQNDGDDIAFVLYSDNTKQLNHEIERYNGTTGELYAWVNITSLSSTDDTKIWMYYNNSDCSSQQNPTGVWDSNYKMVQHMQNATTSTVEDSTSTGITGTKGSANNPDECNGMIYKAQDFDTISEIITWADNAVWTFTPVTDSRTFSLWIYPTAFPTNDGYYASFFTGDQGGYGSGYNKYRFGWNQETGTHYLRGMVASSTWGEIGYFRCTWTPSLNTWYHITFVASSAGNNKIYINGSSQTVSESSWDDTTAINPTATTAKGSSYQSGTMYIDEYRFSHNVRSGDWITTCYNNQINQSTFISVDSKQNVTDTTVDTISPYTVTYSPYTITVTGASGLDNVTLYYRYSTDNSSWGTNVSWDNNSNPDTESPWEWSFNFSNGTGYYEFYSIGNKSGFPDESAPSSADAICYFNESLNTLPEIDIINPQPNGTTDVSRLPTCQVWANDSDGDTLTVYWYENTSGSWVLRNTNNSVSAGTIVSYNFTQFSNYSTTFWWKVAINDSIDNISSWFYFTTKPILTSVDNIDPYNQSTFSLIINSTGNSDLDNVTLYYRWSEDNRSWDVDYQEISIFEGFESGTQNTSLWSTYQTAGGDARIQWNYATARSGSYSCAMDDADTVSGDYSLNVIYTNYNFTGASNINIDFWEREWEDEPEDAPDSWTGWGNYDVVAFTNDGNTWYEIVPEASLNIETFTNFQYNISADPDFSSPPNSSFAIAFQQYDNYQLTSDGRAWDDIYINFTIGGEGINWTVWNNANNPDAESPWNWNFDFPNQTGYYEFYSIGKKSNETDEIPPTSADARCYNNPTTMVDPITPYNRTTSPITITASGNSDFDNVTLYYRWSQDNITWEIGSGKINWSSELLTNPGFETGDTTGWTNGGGGTMTVGTDCPYGSQGPDGTYYAYWLQDNWGLNSHVYQNVSLDSYATYIDAGLAKINVTGWFVSDEYNAGPPPYDESFMNVRFFNASDENMSGCWYESGGTNPVSQGSGNNLNSWTQYGITNYTIPVGARKVQIRFHCWEYDPTGPNYWDSGSAENFSITVGIEDDWAEFGTDSAYPWSWEFNFPNGTGYYEFYTVGNKSGWSNETKPDYADALCKYNRQPTITNEGPSNESTGMPLTPQMNITVNDVDGESMTIIWYSNSSGSWQLFGTNSSVGNGTYNQTNANFTSTGKTYWWYVTVDDGLDINTSAIFHFTTTETAPPQVNSNASTGIEETNATLWGYLYDEGGESCTGRFEYGTTTSYGTNTTNQTISEGEEFSAGIDSLTPGQLYHYRAYVNNTYGSDTGNDITFLTKPQPPTSLAAQANNSSIIFLTWVIGTAANTTYIERNTSSGWALGEGTEIYNGSAALYEDSGISQGTTYYYQAWSYSTWTEISTLFQWSDNNASASNTTNNRPKCTVINPINASTDVNLQPTCEIWANDTDGDILKVCWYENTTGSWVLRQTNNSVEANSTLNWTFTQANAYGTTYWWRVAINDSIDNTTFLYYFITEPINTSVDTITPYVVNTSPLTITATNFTPAENVTLYYRWCKDNITWGPSYDTITIDNTASETENTGTSSMSWTHTVSSGLNNSILIVCTNVEDEDEGDNYYVASADFNGDALTLADRAAADEGFTAISEIWYLLNPDPGSHTVTVNFSIAVNNALGGSASFSNINQSTPDYTNTSTDTGSPSNLATSITTDISNSLIIAVATDGTGTLVYSYGSDQTQIYNVAGSTFEGAGSYRIPSGTGSYIMHTNLSGPSNRMSQVVATWVPSSTTENGINWTEWSNATNPDTESPWSWNYDFPNNSGFYEFYSIGNKSGSQNETAPSSADARCVYTRPPTITNEGPANESIDIPVYPQLNITVNDIDEETMTITWYSNSSGSWQAFGTNTSVYNGTYHQNNSNFSLYLTTFWWYVNVTDGFNINTSDIFHFTTEHSTLIDIIPNQWDIGTTNSW